MKEKSKQLQTFILSLMMLIMGTAGAWGDTETWTTSKDASLTRTHFTVALGGKATQLASGSGNRIRFPKDGDGNSTMTISTNSGETLDGITIDWKSTPNSSPTTATVTSGTWSTTSKNYDTWTKTGTTGPTTVTFTFQDSKDVEIQGITVTYTTGGGSTPTTTTLTVDPDEGSVYVGKTLDIHGYVDTNSNATVTYTSNDDDVATVTSAGVISGVAAGSTTITVSQAANASYTAANETFTITVNAAPTQYTITLAANDNDMGYVTAIYNVADDYNDKAVNDEFTSGTKVSSGTRLTITAHPNTGYEFNETANPYVDGGVTKYRPWGNATGSTTATFTTATLDTGDKTYTAHFKAKTYTITLDKGTGGATDGSATATYNSSALTSVTDATHATLTLKGYYTAASAGTKIINANGSLVASTSYTDGSGNWTYDGDVTLYAQWEAAATYTVTYNANGLTLDSGAVPTDATAYAEGATVTVKGNTGSLAKSGYTFLGWSTASGYQSSYYTADDEFTMGTANVTLYAQWKIDGSISSDPAAGSTVKAGDPVYTTATTSASGVTQMRIAQGGGPYNAETLKSSGNLVGITSAGWSVSNGATVGTGSLVLSALLTDGTFYSDVLTNTFSVGVATPVISCSSNTVTITCATDGAEIYYTTDGTTTPTSGSTRYTAPFSIDATKTIKAIAIKNETNSAVVSQTCTYGTAVTALPVTFDFGASPFSTSTDFSGASGKTMSLTQNSHEVYFHGSNITEFSIQSGTPNTLQMNSNGATNHFVAIPISGINGRIDIDVWAPYSEGSGFTVRAVLDTGNGTTVQTAAPSAIKSAALGVNKYEDSHFNFRMTDITATEGVLYIGPASSSYKNIEKIRITTPTAYLVPDVVSVTIGDDETKTVTIKNYSTHQALLKDVPSYVSASFNPSTGELVITPTAVGTDESITFSVDTNGDGVASSVDLSIPVTVNGITIGTQPVSAVYATGATPAALTVSATHSGSADMNYQWYKNTVNSTEGGEAISGATTATLATGNIDTSASENASFYYCVVSAENSKSKTSDVAYVLTSKTKRYFQMSNVAGNKNSATNDEKITGQVIAGGQAYVQTDGDYRYITRPNTSVPHMYVASSSGKYFKVVLGTPIKAATDVISVSLNGVDANARGIEIYSSDLSKHVTLTTGTDNSVKTYSIAAGTLAGETTLYIKGIYGSVSNYFTDLIISEQTPLAVTAPTPASQNIQTGDTPATISVTASGGDGDYSYQWYSNTSASTSGATLITGAESASYTPPTAGAAGTTYYYCLVEDQAAPTGYASVTVTALSHGYLTLSSSDFTDNVSDYYLIKSNYTAQSTGAISSTNHYWSYGSNCYFGSSSSKDEKVSISGLDGGTGQLYMKLRSGNLATGGMTFYVKGATAFKYFIGNSASRTFTLTVDGIDYTSQPADPANESSTFSLNADGSVITLYNASNDIYVGRFRFYEKQPATVTVLENGETVSDVTLYKGDGAKSYEVQSNSAGTITATSSATGVATASYNSTTGELTVTPVAVGTCTVTLSQAPAGDYAATTTVLNVTVKKHTINLAFSYDEVSFKATNLTTNATIPSGALPTLTATYDDGTTYAGTINYQSDETNIATFPAATTYSIKYAGGQGGARIYAIVNATDNYDGAVAYFDMVVENGTSNNLPKGEKIDVQEQFDLHDNNGQTVVTLTYGGYKFGDHSYKNKKGDKTITDAWTDAAYYSKYYIDGYQYYTANENNDAMDEYLNNLKGMNDDYNSGNCPKGMWYKTSEKKPDGTNYDEYERIRPFNLPCRASYLKFEPKKTGKLTVYVVQNGIIGRGSNSNQIGSKPRLGYWFDQDGWVKHPTGLVISKQPVSNGNGRDTHSFECEDKTSRTLDGQMTYYWTDTYGQGDAGDAAMIQMLRNKYCNDASNPTTFNNVSGDPNPYYWGTDAEVTANNAKLVPDPMRPVPFHGGYMMIEKGYVKYTLEVMAGKTYYFYGMMTKIGYVGMNFVEDKSWANMEEIPSLHLTDEDNMETLVSGRAKAYTVYDEVTLPSRFRKGEWATICLPFALSENQVKEAFGKGTQLTLYNGLIKKGTDYTIKYLSHVDTNILPGQPYFIKPSGVDANDVDLATVGGYIGSVAEGAPDDQARITFNTVVIDKNQFNMETCSYGSNQNVNISGADLGEAGYVFTGSTHNDELLPYSYVMNAGLLRRYTTTKPAGSRKKIPTYMAYLKPNTSAAQSGSMSFTADFSEENIEKTWETSIDDNPTGISIVDADAENGGRMLNNGKVYNMMGQEIDPSAAKGIIIINGKKVMY